MCLLQSLIVQHDNAISILLIIRTQEILAANALALGAKEVPYRTLFGRKLLGRWRH